MAALAAFSKKLASEALAQLYVDGFRDEAFAWASELDPFASTTLRKEIPDAVRGFATNYGSLFDLLLSAKDIEGIDAIRPDPQQRELEVYSKCETMIGAIKSHLGMAGGLAFASALFERLAPKELLRDDVSRFGGHDMLAQKWLELAVAAAKAGQHAWLPKIASMSMFSTKSPLQGRKLLEACCAPEAFDPLTARAILECAKVDRETLVSECRNWAAAENVQAQDFALAAMRELMAAPLKEEEDYHGRNRDAQARRNWILFVKPESTPPRWMELQCEMGLDPFELVGGAGSIATRVLCGECPTTGFGSSEPEQQRARAARAAHEDLLLPLLEAMISSEKTTEESLSAKFDVSTVHASIQKKFGSARKLDLLSALVGKGMYRCANKLVEAGADWRFAAKQCANNLRPSHFLDDDDLVAVASAYFEGLALRSTSLKATAKRDAKAVKSGEEIGAAPARSMRL